MDSLEDRFAIAGNHDKFRKALEKFRKGNQNRTAQDILYETMTSLGASPEEADEFINMECENDAGAW